MKFPTKFVTLPGEPLQIPLTYLDDFVEGGCAMDAALASESDPAGKFAFTADLGAWLLTTDGSLVAARATIVDAAGTAATDGAGVLRLTPGTSANDFVSAQMNGAPWITRSATDRKIIFEARVKTNDADDIKFFVGLATPDVTGSTAGPVLDGTTASIGFRNTAGNTTAFGTVSESASTEETSAPSSCVLADEEFVTLRFEVTNRTKIDFFRNGVLVATHKTTIPLATEGMTITLEVGSPTGTTATYLDVDYVFCQMDR